MRLTTIVISSSLLATWSCAALAVEDARADAPPARARDFAPRATEAGAELAGTWEGDDEATRGEVLKLGADGSGELDGRPLRWRIAGRGQLRYELDGESLGAAYRIEGEVLELRVGAERLRYRRVEPVQGYQVPPALGEVDRSAGRRHRAAQGEFSFELPAGWSVGAESEEGLWIQPGLAPGETLDALILVQHGELELEDQNVAPAALVDRHEAAFRAEMKAAGIELAPAAQRARAVLVGDVPGAVQEWRGKTADGRELRLWLGGVVRRDAWLTVAGALLSGREERFLPGLKRVFATLAPAAPERNQELERLLAGRSFSRSESFGRAGSSTSWYSFGADGRVKKELSMGGLSGLSGSVHGSSEEWGRYEAIGPTLYLYFRDGQSTAEAALEGGGISGLRMHGAFYRLR